MQHSGFFLVDKPEGPTSNRVLQDIRKSLSVEFFASQQKFGHAGTLDSFASGLLIILTGKATRLTRWFMNQSKEYDAVFRFGEETDTLDPQGRIVDIGAIPTKETLENIIPSFCGNIKQIPPSYSAVHVCGKRSYEIARAGKKPEISPRFVTIDTIELQSFKEKEATLRIRCSSGTYIRSLARDFGHACGSCATVVSLRRTKIGPFFISQAHHPNECNEKTLKVFSPDIAQSLGLATAVIQLDFVKHFIHGRALPIKAITFNDDQMTLLRNLDLSFESKQVALFSEKGELLGIAEHKDKELVPKVVMEEESRL